MMKNENENGGLKEYELSSSSSSKKVERTNGVAEEEEEEDYHNAVLGLPPPPSTSRRRESSRGMTSRSSSGDVSSPSLSVPKKKSGLFGASCNLVNSIVGAGIIGIPYAFRQSGLLVGLLLLLLVGYLTDYSLRMIVDLASFHPKLLHKDVRTFEDLAQVPFGTVGKNFILFNMYLMAYGAMVAYLLIIKDTVPTVFGIDMDAGMEREAIMFVTSITIMVPLSLQRDMASLAITSFFSVLADAVLVVFVTVMAPIAQSIQQQGGFLELLKNDSVEPTLFVGLGILSTAMACQHSAFIVGGSLEHKTRHRWSVVTISSLSVSTLLCALLGTAGYLGYGQNTQGDVLNNFEKDADVARALLAFTMFFTYPMECFVARHVLVMLLYQGDMDGEHHSTTDDGAPSKPSYRRHTITWFIYVMTLIPALIVDDIGPVLSITGAIAGGCISYMAPGFIYLGIHSEAFLSYAHSLLYTPTTTTPDDLPLDGDANATISTPHTEPTKPWYWYIFLYPIWISIAKYAQQQQQQQPLEEEGPGPYPYQAHLSPKQEKDLTDDDLSIMQQQQDADVQSMVPTQNQYFMAIFFIVFGVVSLVAGVGSNIYLIQKKIYE